MPAVLTLRLVKGTPLTNQEVDNNFSNLKSLLDNVESSVTVSNNTTVNLNWYPLMANVTSGLLDQARTSNTKFYFNPSTGTLNSTDFNSLSDATLKENITTIDQATYTVTQLRGVSFNWKDNGRKSYGVIAQELEQILPELVSNTGEHKSVNYSGLISFLINAVKELDTRVTVLENTTS